MKGGVYEYSVDGARIRINSPELVPIFQKVETEFNAVNDAFHEELLKRNVKAYRCNDGWVDRQNFTVRFFVNERSKGYYWGNLDLSEGDLIFIGNSHDGGRFARIIGLVENDCCSMGYSRLYMFEPLKETLMGKNGLYSVLPLKEEQVKEKRHVSLLAKIFRRK